MTWRYITFAGLLLMSFWPTYGLSTQAINDLSTPKSVLEASFVGQAHMDILGFGFWVTWSIVFLFEALVLVAAWFTLRQSNLRNLVYLPIGAFGVASVFNYVGYERLYEILFRLAAA